MVRAAASLAAARRSCGCFSSLSVDTIEYPVLRGFNFAGGVRRAARALALVAGLSIYSSAFIAEIVRGSIEGIAKGQSEAALSLGLTRMQTLFLVVLPQALRIMVPQVTGQYLNLTKSTSLGAAVAYPELVQIFAGTVLNQSGRAIESMVLVMGIFLGINLAHHRAHGRVQPPCRHRGALTRMRRSARWVEAQPVQLALEQPCSRWLLLAAVRHRRPAARALGRDRRNHLTA